MVILHSYVSHYQSVSSFFKAINGWFVHDKLPNCRKHSQVMSSSEQLRSMRRTKCRTWGCCGHGQWVDWKIYRKPFIMVQRYHPSWDPGQISHCQRVSTIINHAIIMITNYKWSFSPKKQLSFLTRSPIFLFFCEDVSWTAFKWLPGDVIGTKTTATSQALLMSFTSTPMPKYLGHGQGGQGRQGRRWLTQMALSINQGIPISGWFVFWKIMEKLS